MRLLLFVILFLASSGCEQPDDITQIRAVIDDVVARAQAHDVNGMMAHVTNDYTAKPGARGEQDVRPILLMALRRYGKFRIAHPVPGITIGSSGAAATVSLPFLVVREGQTAPPAELTEIANDPIAWATKVSETLGDPYKIELKMRKSADGWQIRESDISGFKNVHDL